jgi:hypothetical protein
LLALNEAFDRKSVDVLLAMRITGDLAITADGLLQCAGLLTSGLVEIKLNVKGTATGFVSADVLKLELSDKGKAFVEGWLAGNEQHAVGAGNAI